MDERARFRYQTRAEILKALAHPTRLFIVEELARRERSVAELTELVGVNMSTMSRHLSVLRNVGILRTERRGTSIFHQLKCPCVLDFFTCVESVIASNARSDEEPALEA